ncbi:hypothetical protein WG66_009129 [Moniliophthora roreri]|nr:hypothetical protein WG66_009129 [Moniliophthora roreri]
MEERVLQMGLLASSITVLVYDYFLTFQMELDLVWFSPLSWVKGLYLIQRYAPFIDSFSLLLYVWLSSDVSGETCLAVMNFCNWMHFLDITVSELLLTIRAWAACQERFKRLSWILTAFATMCWVPIFMITSDMFKFTLFSPAFAPPQQENWDATRSCIVHGSSSMFYLVYILLSVYQIGILVLLLVTGYPWYKCAPNSKFLHVIFGQGILCYLILISLSTLNVVVILTAPVSLSKLLMPLTRILHSLFTSRTVLDIRGEMRKQEIVYD